MITTARLHMFNLINKLVKRFENSCCILIRYKLEMGMNVKFGVLVRYR